MNVMLVHGIFDNGSVFSRLERRLTRAGHDCFVPSLSPSDGRHGLAALARQLAAYVDENVGTEAPMAIVGFSMGCLVARYYMQHMEGFRRTRAFFAISGPHGGTATAYLYPGQGTRQMRPGSDFLSGLNDSAGCLEGIPLRAYWTPFDATILPAGSCRWPLATDVRILSPVHWLMPANRKLGEDIVEELARIGGLSC